VFYVADLINSRLDVRAAAQIHNDTKIRTLTCSDRRRSVTLTGRDLLVNENRRTV